MNTSLQHQRRRRRLEPDTVRNQKDAARLLAGTLARVKKPARLSLSIRLQLLGLVKHWFPPHFGRVLYVRLVEDFIKSPDKTLHREDLLGGVIVG